MIKYIILGVAIMVILVANSLMWEAIGIGVIFLINWVDKPRKSKLGRRAKKW